MPASSPFDMAVCDLTLSAGEPEMNTFVQAVFGSTILHMKMFGYGTGTGPPGDGVLQTSGALLMQVPP